MGLIEKNTKRILKITRYIAFGYFPKVKEWVWQNVIFLGFSFFSNRFRISGRGARSHDSGLGVGLT